MGRKRAKRGDFTTPSYDTELTKEANGTARLYVRSCELKERRKLGSSEVVFHFQIFAKLQSSELRIMCPRKGKSMGLITPKQ